MGFVKHRPAYWAREPENKGYLTRQYHLLMFWMKVAKKFQGQCYDFRDCHFQISFKILVLVKYLKIPFLDERRQELSSFSFISVQPWLLSTHGFCLGSFSSQRRTQFSEAWEMSISNLKIKLCSQLYLCSSTSPTSAAISLYKYWKPHLLSQTIIASFQIFPKVLLSRLKHVPNAPVTFPTPNLPHSDALNPESLLEIQFSIACRPHH